MAKKEYEVRVTLEGISPHFDDARQEIPFVQRFGDDKPACVKVQNLLFGAIAEVVAKHMKDVSEEDVANLKKRTR